MKGKVLNWGFPVKTPLSYFSPVLHLIKKPVICFTEQNKWLVSIWNAALGWNRSKCSFFFSFCPCEDNFYKRTILGMRWTWYFLEITGLNMRPITPSYRHLSIYCKNLLTGVCMMGTLSNVYSWALSTSFTNTRIHPKFISS